MESLLTFAALGVSGAISRSRCAIVHWAQRAGNRERRRRSPFVPSVPSHFALSRRDGGAGAQESCRRAYGTRSLGAAYARQWTGGLLAGASTRAKLVAWRNWRRDREEPTAKCWSCWWRATRR